MAKKKGSKKKKDKNNSKPSPQWWISIVEFGKGVVYGALRAFTVKPVSDAVKANAPAGLLQVAGSENIDEIAEAGVLSGVLMGGATGPVRSEAKTGLNVAGSRVGGNLVLRGRGMTPQENPSEEWA